MPGPNILLPRSFRILSPKQAPGLEGQGAGDFGACEIAGVGLGDSLCGGVLPDVQRGVGGHGWAEVDEGWEVPAGMLQRGPKVRGAGLVVERPEAACSSCCANPLRRDDACKHH